MTSTPKSASRVREKWLQVYVYKDWQEHQSRNPIRLKSSGWKRRRSRSRKNPVVNEATVPIPSGPIPIEQGRHILRNRDIPFQHFMQLNFTCLVCCNTETFVYLHFVAKTREIFQLPHCWQFWALQSAIAKMICRLAAIKYGNFQGQNCLQQLPKIAAPAPISASVWSQSGSKGSLPEVWV